MADASAVEAELLLADLEQAERRLERVAREARSGDKGAVAEERWLREVVEALAPGARWPPCRRPATRPTPCASSAR